MEYLKEIRKYEEEKERRKSENKQKREKEEKGRTIKIIKEKEGGKNC